MAYEDLIGQSEAKVIEQLKKENKKIRVMSKDGEHFFGTCDYNPFRLNLSIKDGKVTHITKG